MRQQKETEAETEEAEAVRDRDSRNREGEREKGGVRKGGKARKAVMDQKHDSAPPCPQTLAEVWAGLPCPRRD